MAGHAQLKFIMTECSKTQIRLTGLISIMHPYTLSQLFLQNKTWAPSSAFVSSSIPSLQISTAHAQPFRGAKDLIFCLRVPLDSLLVWASSEGSGETARMRRLAWTFAARTCDKYQIRLTRSTCQWSISLHNYFNTLFLTVQGINRFMRVGCL